MPHGNDLAEDVRTMLAQLDDIHRAVATACLEQLSKRRIKQALGLSRRRLDRVLDRIRWGSGGGGGCLFQPVEAR